jgi:FkbM family methyltransferase
MTTRPKVFIATPSHDHKFHASFAFSLFRLQAARLFPLYITKVGGAGVARARNNQVHEFLTKTDCEIFACVDGDIEFQVEHFARCVRHITEGGKLNVNGLYAHKQEELQWCVNAMAGEEMDPATGLQRVATAGTGFKFVHRSVFERIIEAHPELAYAEDLHGERGLTRWDIFSMGVVGKNSPGSKLREIEEMLSGPLNAAELRERIRSVIEAKHPPGRYLTEDWYLDVRCGELGIPVYVDCTFNVKHEGLISFPLNDPFKQEALWPAEFIAAGIAPDHCADVLAGSYDVPYNPETPPTILDIGANVGAFASWASVRWPGCEIHCYEPDPTNFKLLQKTAKAVRAESQSRIDCTQCAVLDRSATMLLHRGLHNCGEHSLFNVGEQSDEAIEVQAVNARALPPGDVLKIDTEGAEWPILTALGSAGRLSSFKAVLLEYHSETDRTRITELLESVGFKLVAAKKRHEHRGELKFMRAELTHPAG